MSVPGGRWPWLFLLVLPGVAGAGPMGCTSGAERSCSFHTECSETEACIQGECQPGCRGPADCPTGQTCRAVDGQCVAWGTEDGGLPDGQPADGGGDESGLCLPVVDGRVTRAEFTLGPGLGAVFGSLAVAGAGPLLPVDLVGTAGADGRRRWSLAGFEARLTEPAARSYLALRDPTDLPVGREFPQADYVTATADLPGVYAFFDRTAEGLFLLGLADQGGQLTRLTYATPVAVLRFPVEVGGRWETEAVAQGSFLGATVRVVDRYTTEVLAAGELTTPAGTFPVVQLRTILRRNFESAGFTQLHTAIDFLGECGGFVAHAVSAEGVAELPAGVRLLEALLPARCADSSDCGPGGRCADSGFCRPDEAVAEPTPACTGNGNGVIEDAEFVVRTGLAGLFRLNPAEQAVDVDLVGASGPDGMRVWDFRDEALGRQERIEETLDPAAQWFGRSFPSATYAAILDAGSTTLAVFRREPGALLLLGLASREPERTLLVYATPIPALRFPLRLDDRWQATTRASGTLNGTAVELDIRYDFAIDAAGRVQLPAGEIPVLRQQIESRQQVAGASYAISRRTQLFLAECLGGVARAASRVNELTTDFTTATELARLTVPHCLGDLQCPAAQACDRGLCVGAGQEGEGEGQEGEGAGQEGEGQEGEGEGQEGEGEGQEGEGEGQEGEGEGQEGEGEGQEGEGEGAPLCNPEGDGILTRDEVLLRAGLTARFLVAGGDDPIPVDLRGSACPMGQCWDFSGRQADDRIEQVEMLPVDTAWFAEDFPEATYASLLDREQGWLGVFRLTDTALQLLGTASVDDGDLRTRYAPPVDLYRFPLRPGDHWTVETTQSGYMWIGWWLTPVNSSDIYEISVAERGEVHTPAGRFQVLQVITRVEQQIPFTWYGDNQVIHTFISECNGIVARVVSDGGEDEDYFAAAARVERLTLE